MAKFKEGDRVWIAEWHQEAVVVLILGQEDKQGVQYYDVKIEQDERTFYPTVEERQMELI